MFVSLRSSTCFCFDAYVWVLAALLLPRWVFDVRVFVCFLQREFTGRWFRYVSVEMRATVWIDRVD